MRRVASMPSRPGIRTSISTTSGWQASIWTRASPVAGLTRDDKVRLGLEDHPESGAHQGLVVDDEHPDARGGWAHVAASGSSARSS